MKLRYSGRAVAAKSLRAQSVLTHIKSIVCISTVATLGLIGSMHANAQATSAQAQYCQLLTPTKLGKLTTALEAARVSSFNAASASGLNPYALSTYPIAYVNSAQSKWNDPTAFLNQTRHAQYLSPYITNVSIAVDLSGAMNIAVVQELVHARWWARSNAYNAVLNPTVANEYIDAHMKIQAAIDLMEAIGFNAASCALNQTQPDNPTRNVLTRVVTTLE
jgi:hypothetical protein